MRAGHILRRALWVAAVLMAVVAPHRVGAGEVAVAVAANFRGAAKEIAAQYARARGNTAKLSFGSTGQLYAQISQAAPFDVFLAADQARPEKTIVDGYAVPGSRFTYATGRIVLYSRDPSLVAGPATLNLETFRKLAVANPATAPYGAAAAEVLKTLGVYDALRAKIVRGTNIVQTYQFVATGNADLGFVALSQVAGHTKGSRWVVPADLHAAIAQDAVLLKHGAESAAARSFLDFLKGPKARAVKERYGYGPGDSP